MFDQNYHALKIVFILPILYRMLIVTNYKIKLEKKYHLINLYIMRHYDLEMEADKKYFNLNYA